MRRLALLLALAGCTYAPAPCADHADCPAAQCINGACVVQGLVGDRGAEPAPQPEPGDVDPRDMDPPTDARAAMDAAPGCEHLNLTVELPPGVGPLRRNEPVRLSVGVADGASLTYSSSAGGAFVEDPQGAQWIARDDVTWPWQTDGIDLTVEAALGDCRVSRSVRVTLVGDLLLGDAVSGQIDVIGSNGTLFGQWRLVDPSGITGLARMPDGGFLVGIRGPSRDGDNDTPEIVRLDPNGVEVLRFATISSVDARPLFSGPIYTLHVVGDEVIAAGIRDSVVHWFSLDGAHLRSVSTDGVWATAVAPHAGSVVIGRNGERRLYAPGDGALRVIGEADDVVEGLYPLRDGGVLVVSSPSEDVVERLEPAGRIVAAPALPVGYAVSGFTPFDDGYLAISRINNRVIELDAALQVPEEPDFTNLGAANPRGILWIDRP